MTYEIGKYPKEYNPKVHGPYHPGRFYGKPDTPFGQVKIGELSGWLRRRNKSPMAAWGVLHRAYWNWAARWYHVRIPRFAPFGQAIAVLSSYYFFLTYKDRSYHKHCKYH